METEGSLPPLQVSANCPYPKPDRLSLCPRIPLPEDPFQLSTHLCLGLPSGFFPSGFPIKALDTIL